MTDLNDYTLASPLEFPDAAGRQRVTDAISSINTALHAMAATRGVVVVRLNDLVLALVSSLDENVFLDVGGELIDFQTLGDEPHHRVLNDSSGHAGTIVNGLLANDWFIDVVNDSYATNIPLFTDQEILFAAGIASLAAVPAAASGFHALLLLMLCSIGLIKLGAIQARALRLTVPTHPPRE